MNINHGNVKQRPVNDKFRSGHIYHSKMNLGVGPKDLWFIAKDYFIRLATGDVTLADSYDPKDFVDVTDEYTLVHNSVLEGK